MTNSLFQMSGSVYLSIAGFGIGFIESALILFFLWVICLIFKIGDKKRNMAFIAISYPGIVGAVGGTFGVVFPLPVILGFPILVLTLLTPEMDNVGWYPAPFFTAMLGFNDRDSIIEFACGEVSVFLSWLLVVFISFKMKLVKENSPQYEN